MKKLLIVTQVVDADDPVLGFFVRWIEEFAKHCEKVTVICLKEGIYKLPENVCVHSLGKERGRSGRLTYAMRFLQLVWKLRNDYDTVFVHMNPEYVVIAGWLWRILGKYTMLWYTHKSVNIQLRIATVFASVVATASAESFRIKTTKLRVVGHGIDTDFFSPDPSAFRGDWILSVGRLMPSKRHDLAIEEAKREGRELRIAGEGPERYTLEVVANDLHASVRFLGGLTQLQLRNEYRTAAYLIHTSETGSLDKVVLEALACGLQIKTKDPALKVLEEEGPIYVQKTHSIKRLIPVILSSIQSV